MNPLKWLLSLFWQPRCDEAPPEVPRDATLVCDECDGNGWWYEQECQYLERVECPECDGAGEVPAYGLCSECQEACGDGCDCWCHGREEA